MKKLRIGFNDSQGQSLQFLDINVGSDGVGTVVASIPSGHYLGSVVANREPLRVGGKLWLASPGRLTIELPWPMLSMVDRDLIRD